MNKEVEKIKYSQLNILSEYRRTLYENPKLKFLFLELTLRCNERCLHCGSSCGDVESNELTFEQYRTILNELSRDLDKSTMMLCITGGEPLLRKDFFDIMECAHDLGFSWGMTSNGILIDKERAGKLKECGMRTISISIDGLKETHDRFRRTPGGYDLAMRGINNLLDEGGFEAIQVTTVINHSNMDELDELYDIFCGMDIDSWRVIGIEPMGRALEHPELLLTEDDQVRLFEFIRNKRMEDMPVTYGCSHFLGMKYEREVRDHYFTCNAGLYAASIMANGDISACLDIERRPEFIYGNVLKDRFTDVWYNKFEHFRHPLSDNCKGCDGCSWIDFCNGGAHHSFDYDNGIQRICFKDTKVFDH